MPEDFEENFEQEISFDSDQLAIIDASMLEELKEHPLIEKAIVIPLKYPDAVFKIEAEYDNAILRSVKIYPAQDESDPGRIKQKGHEHPLEKGKGLDADGEPIEAEAKGHGQSTRTHGASPLSHDSGIERKLRKTPAQMKRMDSRDEKLGSSTSDPVKRVEDKIARSGQRRSRRMSRSTKRRTDRLEADVESFLRSNMGCQIDESLSNEIKNFPDKHKLSESINLAIDMTKHGWLEVDNYIEGPNNRRVSGDEWSCKDGYLLHEDKVVSFDFEWLYSVKELVSESIDKNKNIKEIVEFVENWKK